MFIYTENDNESDKRFKKKTIDTTKHTQNTKPVSRNPKMLEHIQKKKLTHYISHFYNS